DHRVPEAAQEVGRPRERRADEGRAGQWKDVRGPRLLGRYVHQPEPGKRAGIQPRAIHQERFRIDGTARTLEMQAAIEAYRNHRIPQRTDDLLEPPETVLARAPALPDVKGPAHAEDVPALNDGARRHPDQSAKRPQ